ncbi:hypothetical protein ACCT31_38390, partial [Rhizobium ruizarguesonis]
IDQTPWKPAILDHSEEADHAWKICSSDWENPSPGEHTVTSRAISTTGQIQPAMDDPLIDLHFDPVDRCHPGRADNAVT